MFKPKEIVGNGLIAGDVIHLDPEALPNLKIITEEEAEKIAAKYPTRQFIITEVK